MSISMMSDVYLSNLLVDVHFVGSVFCEVYFGFLVIFYVFLW